MQTNTMQRKDEKLMNFRVHYTYNGENGSYDVEGAASSTDAHAKAVKALSLEGKKGVQVKKVKAKN